MPTKFKDFIKENVNTQTAAPTTITLRRIAVRQYPGGKSVALYSNPSLNLQFTIPMDTMSGKLQTSGQAIGESFPAPHQAYFEWEHEVKNKGATQIKKHMPPEEFGDHRGHSIAYGEGGHITGTFNHEYGLGYVSEHMQPHQRGRNQRVLPDFADWYEQMEKKGEDVKFTHHNNATETRAHRGKKHVGTYYHEHKHGFIQEQAEQLDESPIHRIMTIVRTGKEDEVQFRNGHTVRVHPNTARSLHDLWHQVNSSNKSKLSELINSSPDGLVKAAQFADSLKGEKKK